MLTNPEYSVQDWLDLHKMSSGEVLEYCRVIEEKFQIKRSGSHRRLLALISFSLEHSLQNLILPSLRRLLGTEMFQELDLSKVKVIKHKAGQLNTPFTEWDSKERAPIVHLVWSGNSEDLICLAHEISHATQMILSNGALMPPMAREVCAFLGELALIAYTKAHCSAIHRDLTLVWQQESQRYLGSDLSQLAGDVVCGSRAYHYRHNYPLARVAAMGLFALWSPTALATLFASGSTAMSLLKFSTMVQDLQRSETVKLNKNKASEIDEDITALRLSLTPQALITVRTGKIDYTWLYRHANAGCIVGDCVRGVSNMPPQAWVKWRSIGVFALAALRQGDTDILPEAFLAKYLQSADTSADLSLSPATPWVQPLRFDALTALGVTIGQLADSPYHRQFKLSYYLPVEILPPLKANQLRCFLGAEGTPLGLTTWAWLSDDLRHDIHKTGRALQPDEWTGGSHPFVNDWITEPRAFRAVMAEKRDVLFPDHIVSSLRRNTDGSVRRVNKWVGRNLQRALKVHYL